MVWRRMGLLDEAIRDHLELKRRRGADPAEVAREQHEALDPPADRARSSEPGPGGENATAVAVAVGSAADGEMPEGAAGEPATLSAHAEAAEPVATDSTADVRPISGMEETAELDMKAVFEHGTPSAADDPEGVPQPIPGQEHLEFEHDPVPGARAEQ
jgi:hypothetical protein